MSPSLEIPQAGLKLESNPPSNKSATNITPAIGLTLSDGMIEDMIKCFQNGKTIELSLGASPVRDPPPMTSFLYWSPNSTRHQLFKLPELAVWL